jgi:diguanylate cyclase (GGDEF)-like protein
MLSAAVGGGFYYSSLNWFVAHKSEEKITALRLVDAFVTNYSALRSQFAADAPVPSTFRAHSIEGFNKQLGADDVFRLRWVGRPGREIATGPADASMAKTIEAFATETNPRSKSEFLTTDGQVMFRTVYPSFAHEQSCVVCHNKMQPGAQWHLDDLMGAFVIDVPASPFLRAIWMESAGLGLGLFIALGIAGLIISRQHFRQIAEREVAATEIGDARQLAAQIAHMARHDSLTQLPNRVAFSEHMTSVLARARETGESFAVLCVDLDRFKEVNDVFGHPAGDALLRAVSERLQTAAGGAILTRIGGDEFTLISTGGQQTAEALAGRLHASVATSLDAAGQQMRTSLSIGIAIYPDNGSGETTLIANADAALYRAKADGRGRTRFFDAELDMRLRDRRELQHEMSLGLSRGEFILHYQPQTPIDGEFAGMKALIRWNNPARGMMLPGTFISLAEETGLIIPIGEWVLREACREAASWLRPLRITVNLSPAQLRHRDLVELVLSILKETGLPPGRLELEITEGLLVEDFSRAVMILRRLEEHGVRIVMDDSGTGYSSCLSCGRFPSTRSRSIIPA